MLHWFVGFLRREKICIFGRIRLGIISVEMSVPVVGLFSPLRERIFKRKQGTGNVSSWHFILCGNKACNK